MGNFLNYLCGGPWNIPAELCDTEIIKRSINVTCGSSVGVKRHVWVTWTHWQYNPESQKCAAAANEIRSKDSNNRFIRLWHFPLSKTGHNYDTTTTVLFSWDHIFKAESNFSFVFSSNITLVTKPRLVPDLMDPGRLCDDRWGPDGQRGSGWSSVSVTHRLVSQSPPGGGFMNIHVTHHESGLQLKSFWLHL